MARPVHASEDKTITIRFLDPKSGKPLRRMWVAVTQYNVLHPRGPSPSEVISFVSLRTNRQGEVVVNLHEPLPASISIDAEDLRHAPIVPVSQVFDSGIVLKFAERAENGTDPFAKPGEVVIVERRLKLRDYMRRELP